MVWFADLTDYAYLDRIEYTACINVGWLDSAHSFSRGQVSRRFLGRLRDFCRVRVHEGESAHLCNLSECPGLRGSDRADSAVMEQLGTAEIRVFARDSKVFAAPNLILHYVCDHGYKPPDEFIQAVLRGPRPTSNKYARQLLEHTPDTSWLYDESIARIGIGRLKQFWWRGYAADKQREREARAIARRAKTAERCIASMIARYGLTDRPCTVPDCPERALCDKSFCVHHTPIDTDIVVAES